MPDFVMAAGGHDGCGTHKRHERPPACEVTQKNWGFDYVQLVTFSGKNSAVPTFAGMFVPVLSNSQKIS